MLNISTSFNWTLLLVTVFAPVSARAQDSESRGPSLSYATTRGVLDDDILTIVYDQRDGNLSVAIGDGSLYNYLELHLDGDNAPFAFRAGEGNWDDDFTGFRGLSLQGTTEVFASQFDIGPLLPPDLDEQLLLDHLTIYYGSLCELGFSLPAECFLGGPFLGDVLVTDADLVLPEPGPFFSGELTMVYNNLTGELSLGGTPRVSGGWYNSMTLEIVDAPDGMPPPGDFRFQTGMAAWLGQETRDVEDEPTVQAFSASPPNQDTFMLKPGDVIGSLLPPNEAEDFLNHVSIQYGAFGFRSSFIPPLPGGLPTATVTKVVVPEPSSLVLAVLGAAVLGAFAWRAIRVRPRCLRSPPR